MKKLTIVTATAAALLLGTQAAFAGLFDFLQPRYQQRTQRMPAGYYFNNNRPHYFEASAAMERKRHGTGNREFVFSPSRLAWGAYDENGNLIKSGRASGGSHYCPDIHRGCHTPVGTFKIYAKRGADCQSSKFPLGEGGAPMPYCMFFKGGYAVHGSADVPNYNASHGCIRVHPDAAYWLSNNFMRTGTTVRVLPYSSV